MATVVRADTDLIRPKHIGISFFVVLCIALGLGAVFVPIAISFAVIVAIFNAIMIIAFPIWGLCCYLIVFLLNPAETFPALAVVRIEFILGFFTTVICVINIKFKQGDWHLPSDKMTVLLILFFIAMFVSAFASYERTQTLTTCTNFAKTMVFYYLIMQLANSKNRFILFITVFVLMISYYSIASFRSYMSGGFVHTMDVDRLAGTTSSMGDPNSLAATFASAIPIILALASFARNIALKFLLACQALFVAVLVTLTGSRSGLIALLAVVFSIVALSRRRVLYFMIAALLATAGWFLLPQQYQARYSRLGEAGTDLNEASSGRWDVWKSGIRMFASNPVTGIGAGAFLWANTSGDFGPRTWLAAHSLYVQLLAETGVIGTVIWLSFLIYFLKKLTLLSRLLKTSAEQRWIGMFARGFLISAIALLVSGIFGHNLFRYTWYMMAGATVALSVIAGQPDENQHDSHS
jgi:putative inorganic carbon (hco3(-)) transporter